MKHLRHADIPQFRASGRDRLNRLSEFLDNVPAGTLTFTRSLTDVAVRSGWRPPTTRGFKRRG